MPRTSAAIVNALATEIVRMRDEAVFAPTREVLAQTDAQIAALTTRIADIERAADAAVAGYGSVEALALSTRRRWSSGAPWRASDSAARGADGSRASAGRRRVRHGGSAGAGRPDDPPGRRWPPRPRAGRRPRRDVGVPASHPQRCGDRPVSRRAAAGAPAPSPPGGDRHVRSLAGQLPDPRGGRRRRDVGPADPGRAPGGCLRLGAEPRRP